MAGERSGADYPLDERSAEERVKEFATGLFFDLPETAKELPRGQNLLEIEGLELTHIYPPLRSGLLARCEAVSEVS